jgi:hypothetical protein
LTACSLAPSKNLQEESEMIETVKKTAKPKASAQPRKTAAKKTNGSMSNVTEMPGVAYNRVAELAHQFWIERGHQHGYDAEDWFRAEQELRGKAS